MLDAVHVGVLMYNWREDNRKEILKKKMNGVWCVQGISHHAKLTNTSSVPNYKSFQESWRVKVFQV